MQTFSLTEAAEVCGVSVKALRRRADRGTLRVVVRDGIRRVPASELERAGLLPDAEVRALRAEIERLEDQLRAQRLLTQTIERGHAAEADARERAEAAALEARAQAAELADQLQSLASAGWRERRRRLRALRVS